MARKDSKTTGFFRRVGDAVFGVSEIPGKMKRGVSKARKATTGRDPEIPKMFRGFFESRHAGWPEYVMLKVQIAVLALFVTAVIYLAFLPTEVYIFASLMLAFSAYLVYMAATQLKRAFKRDRHAYQSFVAICIAIAWVFVVTLRHSPIEFSLESMYASLIPPLMAVAFVAAAFMAFRVKYGRNFTFGKIEKVRGRQAIVHVGYDICSNVKAGLYTVESFTKIKRGDLVRLSVERQMLGLRGANVRAVLGKVK